MCPWSLALASSIPVLGLERFCPRKGCPWPWPRIFFVSLALALASSLVSSTPPLFSTFTALKINCKKKLFQRVRFRSRVSEMTSSLDVRQKQRAVIEVLVSEEEPPKKFSKDW